jgi:hypothetical protein
LNVDFISHTIGVIFQISATPVCEQQSSSSRRLYLLDHLAPITIGARPIPALRTRSGERRLCAPWDESSLRYWASRKGEGTLHDYWNFRFGLRRPVAAWAELIWVIDCKPPAQASRTPETRANHPLESAMAADIAFL